MNKIIKVKILFYKVVRNDWIVHFFKLINYSHKNVSVEILRHFYKGKATCDINKFEQRFYSQNGEDGILRVIFETIKTTNRFCVEFGIAPLEGNSVWLKKKGWECLWMDGNGDGDIIKKEFITAKNVNKLFKKYNVPKEFDLLSIDIDSNDYWIWKSIKKFSPRVVVVEYNASIPVDQSLTIKYDPNYVWDKTSYFGASLLAFDKLAREKKYTLVACDSKGINAFFVRDDLLRNNFEPKPIKDIYQLPKYGKKINGIHFGYPSSPNKMIEV